MNKVYILITLLGFALTLAGSSVADAQTKGATVVTKSAPAKLGTSPLAPDTYVGAFTIICAVENCSQWLPSNCPPYTPDFCASQLSGCLNSCKKNTN
jgi:hypothetical protein